MDKYESPRLAVTIDVRYNVHMDIKTTIPISEARRRFFDIAEEVQKPGIHYMFTDKGKPKAVLMSAEEFESWQETLEVMREMPDILKDIKETDEAYRTGAYKSWPTLEEVLAKDGFIVADKSNKKYGVSPKTQTKRSKATR